MRTRLVSFSTVTVREYNVAIDESEPSTLYPITLAWSYRREGLVLPVISLECGEAGDLLPAIETSNPFRRVIFPNKAKYAPAPSGGSVSTKSTTSIRSCEDDDGDADAVIGVDIDDMDDSLEVDEDDVNFTFRTSIDQYESRCRKSTSPRAWTVEERRQRWRSATGWSRQETLRYERRQKIRFALAYANKTSKQPGGKELYGRYVRAKYLV